MTSNDKHRKPLYDVPRVFVICPGIHPYDAAAKLGTLIPIMPGRHNPFDMDNLVMRMRAELLGNHNVQPEDLLLLCGNGYLNSIAVALCQERFGFYQVAIYGAKQGDYTPRRVIVGSDIRTSAGGAAS